LFLFHTWFGDDYSQVKVSLQTSSLIHIPLSHIIFAFDYILFASDYFMSFKWMIISNSLFFPSFLVRYPWYSLHFSVQFTYLDLRHRILLKHNSAISFIVSHFLSFVCFLHPFIVSLTSHLHLHLLHHVYLSSFSKSLFMSVHVKTSTVFSLLHLSFLSLIVIKFA